MAEDRHRRRGVSNHGILSADRAPGCEIRRSTRHIVRISSLAVVSRVATHPPAIPTHGRPHPPAVPTRGRPHPRNRMPIAAHPEEPESAAAAAEPPRQKSRRSAGQAAVSPNAPSMNPRVSAACFALVPRPPNPAGIWGMRQLAYTSADADEATTGAIGRERVVEVDHRRGNRDLGISEAPDISWRPRDPPPRPKAIDQIGRAVLQLRLYLGWRQVDVEARAGVDQTTVSRLERGLQKGLSLRKLAAILDALLVGEIEARPWITTGPPTELERMLHGDPWLRAAERADRRLGRPKRTRTTISTRPPSETEPWG
jgi:transcriptional regulator with XRE-family HTH domain